MNTISDSIDLALTNITKENQMFKKYLRTNVAEMRDLTLDELYNGVDSSISVSQEDANNGSPQQGDMVARNPENHKDQWLVAKEYFRNNFIPKV